MSTQNQKQIYTKLLKIKDADVREFCRIGSEEYQALPIQRKAKNIIVSTYILR